MIHFSLFSGIGGFDLASEWMGWNNYLSCELADFPNKVLKYYWPKAYHHRDIKTLDYDTIQDELTRRFGEWRTEPIILTGGFPCQPYSLAGQRKGKEDERHLWPEMLRLIHEIKPDFIVGENVFGLLNWNGGMVFDEVLTDLGTAGYDVTPLVIPAAAVNAPHGRDRIWFVAQNAMLGGCVHGKDEQEGTEIWEFGNISPGNKDGVHLSKGDATNSNNFGSTTGRTEIQKKNGKIPKRNDNAEFSNTDKSDATNANTSRLYKQHVPSKSKKSGSRCWPSHERGNFSRFPTQPPICGGDDGLPTELDGVTFSKWRNESIKGYGNAIVPQVAYEIFKAIELAYSEITK